MEYKLLKDISSAKKGEIYVKGLFSHESYNRDDLYWLKDSKREDYHFFHKNMVEGNPEDFKDLT